MPKIRGETGCCGAAAAAGGRGAAAAVVLQLVVLVEAVVAEGVVGAGADVERHSLLGCNAHHSDKGWILFP